jgi:hypothetical protein
VRLDLEPDFEARPRLPNIGHRLARVARDHVGAFGFFKGRRGPNTLIARRPYGRVPAAA